MFELSQPAMSVDGLLAVPISISQVTGSIRFDLAASVASVDVTMDFTVGPTSGCPTFDLRQTIGEAWLDDSVFAVDDLAHHDFGGGANAELRVLASNLAAGSNHTLRLTYNLGQPNSPAANPLGWDGNKLSFDFWFTDLNPGRYLEMWLPANLLWDHYAVSLDIEMVGTVVPHTLVTNGSTTNIANNHWSIDFPSSWNSSCQMLVIEPSADLSLRSGSVTLASGDVINTELFKHNSVAANLSTVEAQLHGFLYDNEVDIGLYAHGSRFTTYLWPSSRAMEYAAGTTTTLSALEHETFHSWLARGVFPANGQDGWWDEAITSWADAGRPEIHLGLSEPLSTLCDRNRFSRITPGGSYGTGSTIFSGIAEEVGRDALNLAIKGIFNDYRLKSLSTEMLEEELISRLGDLRVADYFQRYVYGLSDSPGANLWIRDAVGDPGLNNYSGDRFWDSPDLWIRNTDDNGNVHQSPEYGQDNWIYARVRNQGSQTAKHFVVTFKPAVFAGSQFVYPNDWLPPLAAVSGFNLPAGGSTVVRAKWPRANIPAEGTHSCLLASVYTNVDRPINGNRVWEHNNLAQKNLTAVDLQPDDTYMLDFQFGSLFFSQEQNLLLEIRRPPSIPEGAVSIIPKNVSIIEQLLEKPKLHNFSMIDKVQPVPAVRFLQATRFATKGITINAEAKSELSFLNDDTPNYPIVTSELFGGRHKLSSSNTRAIHLESGKVSQLGITLSPRETQKMAMEVRIPKGTKKETTLLYDVLQRDAKSGQVIGGVSLHVNVRD